MRAAKARKRLAAAAAVEVQEVGRVSFEGPMFGGRHVLVLRARAGARELLVEFEGRELRPRTARGFVAMVGRELWRRHGQNGQNGVEGSTDKMEGV
jgi:hypothetical protein